MLPYCPKKLHSSEISVLDFYFNWFCYYNWNIFVITLEFLKVVSISPSGGASMYMNLVPSLITNQCTTCSPAYSSFSQKAILLSGMLQNKNKL